MNSEVLKEAGIDYDLGVKRFAGRAQLYEKALSKFQRDTTFSRICAAYEAGDSELFMAGVHELKGMSGNISIPALFEPASALMELLRSGDYSSEQLSCSFRLLCENYDKVFKAVTAASEEVQ